MKNHFENISDNPKYQKIELSFAFIPSIFVLSISLLSLIKNRKIEHQSQKSLHTLIILILISLMCNSISKLIFPFRKCFVVCILQAYFIEVSKITFAGFFNFLIIFQYIYVFRNDKFQGKIKVITWIAFSLFAIIFPLGFGILYILQKQYQKYNSKNTYKFCAISNSVYVIIYQAYMSLFNLVGIFFCIISYRSYTTSFNKRKAKPTLILIGSFCIGFLLINFIAILDQILKDEYENVFTIVSMGMQLSFSILTFLVVLYFCFENSVKQCLSSKTKIIDSEINNKIPIIDDEIREI